jgi:hypothetical protein
MGIAAPAAGTTATEAAVRATPGPATDGEPQTPEGIPEDMLEESEEEPEMALEPVNGPDDIPMGEAVSTAHWAVSQVQRVLCREGEDLANEHWCLQLWASMLKRMTVFERAAVLALQHGFDLQVEAISQRDADSKWALADTQELYASTEARAGAVIKLEEDLTVHARQINQWAWEVEELEGQL